LKTGFDVDPYALAEEIGILLKKEKGEPKTVRLSFKQLSAKVYRGHNIRGELWHDYNSAVGKILRARPRKVDKKSRIEKTPPYDPRMKTHGAVSREVGYEIRSFFMPIGTLVVMFVPGAEFHFRLTDGRMERSYARNTLDCSKKTSRHLSAFARRIAKKRFAEKEKRQGELDL